MPGLKQLKKFNSDILSLGNEAELRSQRGEEVVLPPIPPTVKDEDDSGDFIDGMPLPKDGAAASSATPSDGAHGVVDIPDIASINSTENGDDMPDLSLFDDAPAVEESLDREDSTLNSSGENSTPENNDSDSADMGLDALLGGFSSLTDLEGEDGSDSLPNAEEPADVFSDSDNFDGSPDGMSTVDSSAESDLSDSLDFLDGSLENDSLDSSALPDIPVENASPDTFDGFNGSEGVSDSDAAAGLSDFSDDFAHFDDLNDLSSPDNLPAADDLDFNNDVVLNDKNTFNELDSLDRADDLERLDSLDDFDGDNSEDYVHSGESFSLDDLASLAGDNLNLDDLARDSLENPFDLSFDGEKSLDAEDKTPSETADDDLGFEVEDYSAPEKGRGEGATSSASGGTSPLDAVASETTAIETADDDLGFEVEDYSAPEEGRGEGSDSSTSKGASPIDAAASETTAIDTADDDLGFEIEEYSMPEGAAPSESPLDEMSLPDGDETTSSGGNSDGNLLDDLDFDIEEYSMPSNGGASRADAEDVLSQAGDDMNLPNIDEDGTQNADLDDAFSALGGSGSDGADFDFGEGAADDAFDTSAMDGLDFPSTDEQLSEDGFELGNDSDIRMDGDEFEIPGFSDVPAVEEKKKGKTSRQKEDEDEDLGLPPNTLSDEQYKKFLDNLAAYPLNVRLALEQLIVDDEFTDETEFELIKKVVRKIPARQLASELEKMLDIAIPVPRDFERRTTAEYEAYKSSLQYQIKNRIVPAVVLGLAVAGMGILFFLFGRHFIYEPAMASSLYRQGYEFLEDDNYPQAEIKFNEASKYDAQKKWFFRYARAYRDKKQYIRAEQMYKAILFFFKHDKQAGLEYARMELDDLANYEKAENILLRDCLDYHINDADCILLLGDTYLEWATEKDPRKFEDARARYSELINLYGQTDLYMSRMMRYFIRTDNLLEVLTLKERFMPKKKEGALGAEDWTALSGFLLDKLYGYLKPSEEYLRNRIDDVKETLSRALRADPTNPIALYNFSRYYMVMNNNDASQACLLQAIDAFSKTPSLKKRDMYKYINSYKFLGEQLMEQSEYLKAREAYTSGISLFNLEKERSNLVGTSEIGELYADMGDLDYFISGDFDAAKANYELSINNDNDNGKIRYKIGNIQYGKQNYFEALGSFMKAAEEYPDDPSLLIAMGNTLSMRDDIYAAMGYYDHLKNILDLERKQKGLLFPQTNAREGELVDTYMRTTNNLGVSLYRLSRLTGDSSLNAKAIVNFQESLRAWDALTRNQQTLVRLGGSNLAEQNIRYLLQSIPQFEPAIYTEIPNTLTAEEGIVP